MFTVVVMLCVPGAGQLNADCRGQQLSTNDLLEKIEEDHEKQVGYTQMHNQNNSHYFGIR